MSFWKFISCFALFEYFGKLFKGSGNPHVNDSSNYLHVYHDTDDETPYYADNYDGYDDDEEMLDEMDEMDMMDDMDDDF